MSRTEEGFRAPAKSRLRSAGQLNDIWAAPSPEFLRAWIHEAMKICYVELENLPVPRFGLLSGVKRRLGVSRT